MRTPTHYFRFTDQIDRALTEKDVDFCLHNIWREYGRRKTPKFVDSLEYGLSPNEHSKNFLRREIYALGIELRKNPGKWSLSDYVNRFRISKSTREDILKNNVFHALLMGIFEEDYDVSRQERHSLAAELEYAFRHDIKPELICGFIYQSGGRKNLHEKLKGDFVEPAFKPRQPSPALADPHLRRWKIERKR